MNPGVAADRSLRGKVIVMSGGSRGIGLAIALRAAADGAKVTLIAKTAEPHPNLEGTIYTAAEEIERAGGECLAVVGDVRDDASVEAAVQQTSERFGGVDIVVNNASAIDLSDPESLPMKRYDLMQDVNTRGTYLLTRTCIPHLKRSDNAHILTLSPPLNLNPRWFSPNLAYTIAKYGMSMCTLGFAENYRSEGIAANSLWPRTTVATAAIRNLLGGDEAMRRARHPGIMADAAHAILTRPSRECTGNFFIDDEVLAAEGVSDLSRYGGIEGQLQPDAFLD
jgi:citronellol/citronellal dehydrogenase